MMSRRVTILKKAVLAIPLLLAGLSPSPLPAQDEPDWIKRSNENAQVLLEVLARSAPELAARFGVDGLDEEISDYSPGFVERNLRSTEEARDELASRLENEPDGPVRQDLEILIARADQSLESTRIEEKHLLPYFSVSQVIYGGLRNLLEDRIPAERRQAALVRLKKYTGRAEGFEPMTELVEAYLRGEWTDSDRLPPYSGEVERDLNTNDRYVTEIGELFAKYELDGYEDDYEVLKTQIAAFDAFVTAEILPRTRSEFQLPEEVYSSRLRRYGVDMPIGELRRRAAVEFKELQDQMQALAFMIAVERGLDVTDYRDVMRELKKDQFEGEDILPFYRERMAQIEAIIEREGIVTLPEREMRIRLATEAESARSPAPFMSPPRLIGNTGEFGEFVLPVRLAGGDDGSELQVDDFTHEATSWPLAAHEGRPGHELQYASIVEKGVSLARALFARNSVNSEGWALYMEEQMLPYIPVDGQFATMWSRLVRSARAFLDPGLNMGLISREEAERVLRDDVMLSEALVRSELERYTFRAPGQATSYYNGYLRLMELRAETELLLGDGFVKKDFHDFILAQGLLPLRLVREAALTEFVGTR
jgi:hypothetical protein